MDKRKVILAYQKGFITLQECAQIMGMDVRQVTVLANDLNLIDKTKDRRSTLSGI